MKNIELISQKIFEIRGLKVMLDFDLAELYESETRILKQAVRRNANRFPSDFMFELNASEIEILVSQNVIPSKSKLGGANPFAFTEQGVAMLSSVLNNDKAIEINIAIMRSFVALRKYALTYEELTKRISEVEKQFPEIYKVLNYLMQNDNKDKNQKDRNLIGYKKDK
ncbi:MAG TPA: ORF6N domain-containing protein [Flavobacterium sp.]|uniref:ORF6N domain-containing protein n=1 Tax=Flavobacterium sp. TaxID=239 RepID=UPI002CA01BE6|nr:ORF6N domain-containing protein [Flavobacterium sp.]MCA0348236.1 ORF6N domain-containing protein [Bacteroidota bacterium]HPW97312.1 ORF6N domain-containing protein [Flavobacterium sp.]HQA73367.1 ORF6N domain-containing protein [Flavobacterium sp.]